MNFDTRTIIDLSKLYPKLHDELKGDIQLSQHSVIGYLQKNRIKQNLKETVKRNISGGIIKKDFGYLTKYVKINNINYDEIAKYVLDN